MSDHVQGHARRASGNECGQALALFALAALFFVALLAVAADSSFVWMQKRDLQNTADAAALAAAQELDGTAESRDAAVAAATTWAEKNISDAQSVEVEILDGYTKVRVTVRKKSASLFSGPLSFGSPVVPARAAARIASVNSLAPCVVPLGVQESSYNAAKTNPGALVELKLAVNGGPGGTSNTGLLNLSPGNSAVPIANGACNSLEPEVRTKPGGTIGDVNNGLERRLKAAIASDCYTEADVVADWPRCRPTLWSSDSVQSTAVMLLPVLDADIVESGAKNYSIAQIEDRLHLLAYFWVDGDSTYEDPANNKWRCLDGQSKCIVRGKFLFDLPIDLSVFDPAMCPPRPEACIIDFRPEALVKVVLLDE
jgi:Flp pilus assembly protein TadG